MQDAGSEGGSWCEREFQGKVVRSWLKWAGPVERMEGERLTKRADALRVEGRRRVRRPVFGWEEGSERGVGRSERGVRGKWEGIGGEEGVKQNRGFV